MRGYPVSYILSSRISIIRGLRDGIYYRIKILVSDKVCEKVRNRVYWRTFEEINR
jgi:hypothetical protein